MPTTSLQELLSQLRSPKPIERVKAAQSLGQLSHLTREIAVALEQAALNDADSSVRYWAQRALQSPAYLAAKQGKDTDLKPASKKIILEEIARWEKEGLIDDELAIVLLARYGKSTVAPPPVTPIIEIKQEPKAVPAPKPKPQPKRSLSEILFSQTTINIALFLGAFFVLASALFLAALNASMRVPILAAVTIVFLAGALGFRRRLPSASLTLFIVYSLLVPILTRVLLESDGFAATQQQLVWLLVSAFLTANWAYATISYHSRLFAVLALVGFNSLAVQLGNLLNIPRNFIVLMLTITNLASLTIAFRFKRLKDVALYSPIYVLSEIFQVFLITTVIGSSFPFVFFTNPGWNFLGFAGTLLISAFYFYLSHRSEELNAYPYLTVACLLLLPWYVLRSLSIDTNPTIFALWLWGSAFAVVGHRLLESKKNPFLPFGLPLLISSGFLYAVSGLYALLGLTGTLPSEWLSFVIFSGIAAVYTYLTIQKPRHLVWGSALLAAFFAYWSFLALPFLENVTIFQGFLFLLPALAYLSLDVYASKVFPKEIIWRMWPRVFGAIVALITISIFLSASSRQHLRVSIGFLALSLFLIFYINALRAKNLAYLVTTGLALSLVYLVQHLRLADVALPLVAMGGIYLLVGYALVNARKAALWARPLYVSGLALTGLMALTAPGATAREQGLYLLLATTAFVLTDLSERLVKPAHRIYSGFTRFGSVILSIYGTSYFLISGFLQPWESALAFVVYAAVFLFYAIGLKSPGAIYAATTALVLSAIAVTLHFEIEDPTYQLLTLGSLYYLGGLALFRLKKTALWAHPLHISGLVLIGLVALFNYFSGWPQQISVFVFASIAFVLGDLARRARKSSGNFMLLGGVLFTSIGVVSLIDRGSAHPLIAVAVSLIFAALFLFYAINSRSPNIALLSTAALALAVFYLEGFFKLENWLPGLALLSIVYLAGSVLPQFKGARNKQWRNVLETSTLGLGVFIAASAFGIRDGLSVVSLAVVATIFAVQAYQKRNVGRAILANFIYLEAYLLALATLEVDQPQFYSMGAALLGLIMHYILSRSRISPWTFIAGMLSSLVLLSTTYYQMVTTEQFSYFLILFFQSLAVTAYGVVIRSRSLVAVPIGFVVLQVATLVYSELRGFSETIIIGCTGFALLALAIFALIMRERISDTSERVRARLSGWSA